MKKKKALKKLGIILIIFTSLALFLLYGPIKAFRETLITSAMTTKSHQYIAKMLYSKKTIDNVMKNNTIIEASNDTKEVDVNEIDTILEKEIKEKGSNELYKVIKIKEDTYKGYLVAIYDASRVKIGVSKYLGKKGEKITTVAKDNKAKIAINAGGFFDPDWNSNGAIPHGLVIKDGKVVSNFEKASVGGGLVGFNKNNELVLGNYTEKEALDIGIRDAVEFGPYLIVNGKKSTVKGNGGWGIAPRTVIGQRKDKIVLFLVIDGRTSSSFGADMNDLIEIMSKCGAVNAVNMDGGSSSELLINGKIINKPVGNTKDGLRLLPTFWIVE